MISKLKKFKKASVLSISFSVFLVLLILLIIGFLFISNFKINQKRSEMLSRIEGLEKEIQRLEEKKAALQAKIPSTSEEDYLEKEARETLGLKKPGEEVVVVLPSEESPQEETQKEGFWQRFFKKLKFW